MNEKARVMVNGLPGKMATIIMEEIARNRQDLALHYLALTGENQPQGIEMPIGNTDPARGYVKILFTPPKDHERRLDELVRDPLLPPIYAIHFCKGEGVALRNAELYCARSIPFVMGSTVMGGKANEVYAKIKELSERTKTPCVVAPNFDERVAAWMGAWNYMSEKYAGAFAGTNVEVAETHQADKKKKDGTPETSGTARAMIKGANLLAGSEIISEDQIVCIRDPQDQIDIGVPEKWLGWHAYHRFTVSNDHDGVKDSEELVFKRHGGDSYKRGALKSLDFLLAIRGNERKFYHTMIDDVLNPNYLK